MKKSKETSFADYFKEDIFSSSEKPLLEWEPPAKERDWTPVIAKALLASEPEKNAYWKLLRNYFLTGKKTKQSVPVHTQPLLMAPYLRGKNLDTGYPSFANTDTGDVIPLQEHLLSTFNVVFKEHEADILRQNLPRLDVYVRQSLDANGLPTPYLESILEACEKLREFDVRGDEGIHFRDNLLKYQNALSRFQGFILSFSHRSPFELQSLHLSHRNARRQMACGSVKNIHRLLSERLAIYSADASTDKSKMLNGNFADQLISIEKLADMVPEESHSALEPARLDRMMRCLQTLEGAKDTLPSVRPKIFSTAELIQDYNLTALFPESEVIQSEHKCFVDAQTAISEILSVVSETVRAMRTAQLELTDKYDAEVQELYLDKLDFTNYTEEEFLLLQTVLVILPADMIIAEELERFSKVLSVNLPIRIVVLDGMRATESGEIYKRELSALALSHRGAYVFQGAADTPSWLAEAFREGFNQAGASLWSLMVPEISTSCNTAFLQLNAAAESRYFPRWSYSHSRGIRFGSRFDISANAQPEHLFPYYSISVFVDDKKVKEKVALTPADFFYMEMEDTEKLEIVPPDFETDELVPLDIYLDSAPEDLVGMVPYIYLLDTKNRLYKGVVSYAFVNMCMERLDNWQFIQELGGINSHHVDQAIVWARQEWQVAKEKEIKDLEETHRAEIDKIRREEAAKALERLADVLLNLDVSAPASSPKNKSATPPTSEVPTVQEAAPAPEAPTPEVSSEAWVESYKCTSCNDCTNKLPAVFKYNSDKQAFVHDPKKGTYAQIVMIAEKCPALCIHPGLPQNPDEPGLEELIKRAEVLN
jgi:ferredoxin